MRIGITGAVGVGKTTLASALAEKLGYELFDFKAFAKEYVVGYDEEMEADVVDVGRLSDSLSAALLERSNVVVESHLLVEMPLPLDILIVLRANPLELERRLLDRGYSPKKAYENALSEALDYFPLTASQLYPSSIIYEVMSDENVLEKALEAVEGKLEKTHYSFPEELKKLALRDFI